MEVDSSRLGGQDEDERRSPATPKWRLQTLFSCCADNFEVTQPLRRRFTFRSWLADLFIIAVRMTDAWGGRDDAIPRGVHLLQYIIGLC